MVAIDRNGRPLHHGGAGRTIGEIYAGSPGLRAGFKTRREIEAEQFRDGWPVIGGPDEPEPPAPPSAARLELARFYQNEARAQHALAVSAFNAHKFAPESAASIWVRLASEYRDEWLDHTRKARRAARTARMLMGVED